MASSSAKSCSFALYRPAEPTHPAVALAGDEAEVGGVLVEVGDDDGK